MTNLMLFIFWLSPFVLPFPLALLAVVASGVWLIRKTPASAANTGKGNG